MEKRLQRIRRMEEKMEKALSLLHEAEEKGCPSPALQAVMEELDAYYTSPLWMEDFQADEQGLLPRDMKRGILSQDGLWNLLSDYTALTRNNG
ncbi:MAG: DUF4298 domain-containing protein [Clostridia bacterium]|nr:DUF4298 domain-containing protein [Clostridia bacterium]